MVSVTSFWILWTIFVFLVVFHFFPTCVAFVSRHPERRSLAMLNILSLFSFALWLALMVWAVGGQRDDSTINRFMGNRQHRRWIQLGAAGIAAFSFGSTLGGLNIV
jgi:uncharacterized membrane protein